MSEQSEYSVLRKLLLLTLAVSLLGTLVELLLLGHFDGITQMIPLILLGATILTLGWYMLERGPRSIHVLRVLMVVFLLSGALGTLLHYKGNVEFELEMYPDMHGWQLFAASMTGATPALAPGAMIQIGLIGLAWAFRHPALTRRSNSSHHKEPQ